MDERSPALPFGSLLDSNMTLRHLLLIPDAGHVDILPGHIYTVGRDPDCDIPLRVTEVSRLHAQFRVESDRLIVQDLDSKNGTFVNGAKVACVYVPNRSIINFGKHIDLTYQVLQPDEPIPSSTSPAVMPAVASSPKSPMVSHKTTRLGPYLIEKQIGGGAMGIVCRGRIDATGELVALKLLPRAMADDADLVARFRREGAVGLELNHPNIVGTLDMGEWEGHHFIAMEFIQGSSAQELLDKNGILGEALCVRIGRDVSLGLAHAHQLDLIHRDISPGNIIFGSMGEAKVTDFGLVKAEDSEFQTQIGLTVGTPHYIAPEQIQGIDNIDGRADIYALGATLYHLSTGQLPFPGEDSLALMKQHLRDLPPPIQQVNPRLTTPFCQLIMRLLEKNRNLRPDADALADLLEKLIA
jgi:serine/threonine protein kinase